ncbi:MAG: cyclic pyranopterin monophosphate synthase MoaC [Ignavibacteria bacterium]|nr:cyclic pyranopterin monophosphate synthase MoaC [Ignavibacteria bacterium]
MKKLSHVTAKGKAKMVDVSAKNITLRTAKAFGEVVLGKEAFTAVANNTVKKGDVLAAAKIAGIQAAKKTNELIPLCHNIFISFADIKFTLNKNKYSAEIESEVKTNSVTGVEMEALCSVTVAALTIYDMCKSISKQITISNIHLLSKTGGKSGDYNYKL